MIIKAFFFNWEWMNDWLTAYYSTFELYHSKRCEQNKDASDTSSQEQGYPEAQ